MSSDVLSGIDSVLGNPLVRAGLRTVSPEAALAVDAIRLLAGGLIRKRGHAASEVIAVMDQRFAGYIKELTKENTSAPRKRELEVRIHELLGVLDAWDKVS